MKTTQKSRAWGAWRLLGTMVALLATSLMQGAQVSFSSTLSIKPTDWTNTVSLPQFDSSWGTLQAVTIQVSGTFRSISRVENVTAVPAPGTLSGALGSLTVFDPLALESAKQSLADLMN